jgi:muramidase (phage lysozyme)
MATINSPFDGSPLGRARRAFMDTIARYESPSYNTMYGGTKFTSYADHPRVGHRITSGPNKGRLSTAAGRYQFKSSTWDSIAREIGLTDFSPESQDIAGYALAARDYQAKTGQNLDDVLATADPAQVASAARELHGTWTSLPGGIEAGTSSNKFARQFARNFAKLNAAPVENIAPNPDTSPIGNPQPNAGPAGMAYADLVPPTEVKVSGLLDQPKQRPEQPEVAQANGFAPGLQPASFQPQGPEQPGLLGPAQSQPRGVPQLNGPTMAPQPSPQAGLLGYTPERQQPVKQDQGVNPLQATEHVVGTTPNPLDDGVSDWTMGGATPSVADRLPNMGTSFGILGPVTDRPPPVDPNYKPAPAAPPGLLNPAPIAQQTPAIQSPTAVPTPTAQPTIAAPVNPDVPMAGNALFPGAPSNTKANLKSALKQAAIGAVVGGPTGAAMGFIGGLLGGGKGIGGLLGGGGVIPQAERFNAGFGIPGIEAGMYGARGATGFSRSNPGAFVTSRGPNQGWDLTNQMGAMTHYTADGHIAATPYSGIGLGGLLGGMFGGNDRGGFSDKDRADWSGRTGLF